VLVQLNGICEQVYWSEGGGPRVVLLHRRSRTSVIHMVLRLFQQPSNCQRGLAQSLHISPHKGDVVSRRDVTRRRTVRPLPCRLSRLKGRAQFGNLRIAGFGRKDEQRFKAFSRFIRYNDVMICGLSALVFCLFYRFFHSRRTLLTLRNRRSGGLLRLWSI
jgi:hypothetical protein